MKSFKVKEYQTLMRTYKIALAVVLFSLIGAFVFRNYVLGFNDMILSRHAWLWISIIFSVLYIFIYRRMHLFCYETIFLFLFVFSTFFQEIIMDHLEDLSNVSEFYFSATFSQSVVNKSTMVQMIGLFSFLLGSAWKNFPAVGGPEWVYRNRQLHNFDFELISKVLPIINSVYIFYLFWNNTIATWFHYSNYVDNYSNTQIIYLTVLLLVNTIFEFVKLNRRGCSSFGQFMMHVNKLYLANSLIIILLLLISGNRNESLLFFIPIVVMYSLFIHTINNRTFVVGVFIGVLLMSFIGVNRQEKASSLSSVEMSLLDVSRDYLTVEKNTTYLIDYTDRRGPIYFKNTIMNLFSSIPYLGGLVSSLSGVKADVRSTTITTEGMQMSLNMGSGLGTSLIGDVYYSAKTFFVVVFFFVLGGMMSFLYNMFEVKKEFNIWWLVVYVYMVANSLYGIRAEWNMPFRYIGFSFVVMLLFMFFLPRRQINVR